MSRILVYIIFILFCPLIVYAGHDSFSGDGYVIPGERVGNILLDKSVSYIEKEWGKPESITLLTGVRRGKMFFYDQTKGVILITERNRIKGIVVLADSFKTQEELSVGSSADFIEKFYGKGEKTGEQIVYKNKGISFLVKDGKIKEISISEPIK